MRINEKNNSFPLQETPMLTISFFENRDLVHGTAALVKYHFFDKLILGVCLLHQVFLSDVLNDALA